MAGSLILSGNQFHIAGPATEKARRLGTRTFRVMCAQGSHKMLLHGGTTVWGAYYR